MNAIAQATGCVYKGFYPVGRNWIGGIYFVKEHPLFNVLPTNTAMGLTKHWSTREIRN